MNDYEKRVEIIKKIENFLKSDVITLVYNTSSTRFRTQLASDILPSFNELLQSISGKKGLRSIALLLHSSGGYLDVIPSFVYMIRKKSKYFQVIIPEVSHSAATMICFGADKILMSDLSSLSPVDPQITLKTQSGNIGAGAEDIGGYYSLIKDMFSDDSARIQAFIGLLNRFPAEVLGQIKRIQKQTGLIATKMLEYHEKEKSKVKKIVGKFQKDFFSHNYRIHFDEAKKIGLKVEMMNSKLEESAFELLKLYKSAYGSQADIEIDIPEDKPYEEIILNRAYLECKNAGFSYKTRYRVFKDKKVEIEELGWARN